MWWSRSLFRQGSDWEVFNWDKGERQEGRRSRSLFFVRAVIGSPRSGGRWNTATL